MKRTRLLAMMLIAASPWAFAQVAQDDEYDQEEVGRGVARISLLNGDVSVRRGDAGDYTAAAINAPLVVDDRLITGANSYGEIQFDHSNMLRLAADSEARLAELENRRYMVQLARGTATFRVLRDQQADVEISTPSISVRPAKRGSYRVEVRDDGTTAVTVRSGEAEIYTPKGTERVTARHSIVARGTTSDPEFRDVDYQPEDDWDRLNDRRDRDLESSQSYKYVSRDVYGAEDLDRHGRWVNDAQYGYVWSPYASAGWAPYQAGRWVWVDWYGWTWVSYDPWGWAPYHYGRWYNHASYGWVWWPGGLRTRHYWRPALVGFFGWGGGGGFSLGVGIGFGRVGWCPLAPYERFRPWYGSRYYRGGYNNVTVVNNVNITNIYRNSRHSGGATVISGQDFQSGRVTGIRSLNSGELRSASLVQGPVPVAPNRTSRQFADRSVNVRSAETNGRFYSRRQPAAVDRVSFDEQRRGLETFARRGAEGTGATGGGWRNVGGGDAVANTGRRGAEGVGAAETGRGGGWRNAGQSAGAVSGGRTAESVGGRTAESGDRGGWRRFGEPSSTGAARSAEAAAGRAAESNSGSSRRMGDAGTSGRGAESDSGSWRRFGEPSVRSNSGSSGRTAEADSSGWRRLGSSQGSSRSDVESTGGFGSRRSAQPDVERSGGFGRSSENRSSDAATTDRGSWRRFDSSSNSSSSRSAESYGGRSSSSDSRVRITAPVVRERSSGSSSGRFGRSSERSSGGSVFGGSRSSGGFGGRSSESGVSRSGGFGGRSSAPSSGGRMSSGGSFGGGRSSGGGFSGGGGRSSGGGGGRSGGGGGRRR
ncbi:MAG: FecR family protein [Bryobacteraceae bacterium]